MRFHLAIGTLAACLMAPSLALANNHSSLFSRQAETCPENFSRCAGFGDAFTPCCPADYSCLALANNTTKLCCQKGSACTVLNPISCNLALQNISLHPKSTVSTTLLETGMRKCRDGCCPHGFGCDMSLSSGRGACRKLADQSKWEDPDAEFEPLSGPESSQIPSASETATATATAEPSATSTATTSPTASPTDISLPDTVTREDDPAVKFPASAIIAGFFPGLALGVLIAVGVVCFLGSRRRKALKISSPALIGGQTYRSDFVHSYQPPEQEEKALSSTPTTTMGRVKSLFRKSNATVARQYTRNGPQGLGLGLPVHPAPARPQHPRLKREPSEESINVFVDTTSPQRPKNNWDTPHTTHTTFSDMMERADLGDVSKNGYVLDRASSGVLPRESGVKLSPHTYTPQISPQSSLGRSRGRKLV